MSNHNIAIEGNPEMIQRFLLKHEFQIYYKQFDAQAVSHDAAPISTRTPVWLVIAINKFLDGFNLSKFIDRYKETHPEEIDANAFLKYLLMTDIFIESTEYGLERYLHGDNHPDVWPNCVFDKTTKQLYPSQYGNHRSTIETVLSQHPELRADSEEETIQNQNDFIMNQLILIGNKGTTDYYQAKYEVHSKELMVNQKPLDMKAIIQERFDTFDHALNTPDNGTRYISYCFQSNNDAITETNQTNIAPVVKRFAQLGFLDEFEAVAASTGLDAINLISSARLFWPEAERHDYDLTLLTVTEDAVTERSLCF
jgi:hypothetical protein